jgi:cytochrome c oxidase subunit 3
MTEELTPTHETSHRALQHHFENMEQQREAGTLGMWVFLVTEIMFFGGLFLAYTLYRYQYPAAFASASNHLDITLGAINTVVLIVSSFTMAMAVYSTQIGRQRGTILCLVLTMILGATFLGIKAVEYHDKYNDHLIPGQLIPLLLKSPNPERLIRTNCI